MRLEPALVRKKQEFVSKVVEVDLRILFVGRISKPVFKLVDAVV